jgi:hypothetical protein
MPIVDTNNQASPDGLAKPKKILIEPANVNREANRWNCRVLVRCPKGVIQDDLRDPGVWHKVQQNQHVSLRKFDELLIVAFDESWYIRALVVRASNKEAQLSIERASTFCEIREGFYSDGEFRAEWCGSGYQVVRLRDGQPMSSGHATEDAAIAAIRALRPHRVA